MSAYSLKSSTSLCLRSSGINFPTQLSLTSPSSPRLMTSISSAPGWSLNLSCSSSLSSSSKSSSSKSSPSFDLLDSPSLSDVRVALGLIYLRSSNYPTPSPWGIPILPVLETLLQQCPNHGFDDVTQMQTFCNGLRPQTKILLDASIGDSMNTNMMDKALNHMMLSLAQNKLLTQQLEAITKKISQLPQQL
ncbi:hypothetical protein CR513_56452, partial [Mucuna pruriens]